MSGFFHLEGSYQQSQSLCMPTDDLICNGQHVSMPGISLYTHGQKYSPSRKSCYFVAYAS